MVSQRAGILIVANQMAKFLKASGRDRPLAAQDWTSFSRGYNGPDFARNLCGIDGLIGELTRAAAQAFREAHGMGPVRTLQSVSARSRVSVNRGRRGAIGWRQVISNRLADQIQASKAGRGDLV